MVGGNRDKEIAAAVSDFVFYVSLFVPGGRIAEVSLKTVVQFKSCKAIRQFTLGPGTYVRDRSGHVIRFNADRNAADMVEDAL